MSSTEWISRSAEETIEIGRKIAESLKAPVLVFLSGDLGAGKTTLSKGIISGLGAAREEDVTSPTFTLVHVFENRSGATASGSNKEDAAAIGVAAKVSARAAGSSGAGKVYHIDLYRIEHSA